MKNRPTTPLRFLLSFLLASVTGAIHGKDAASDVGLSGLWMETNNYPASSVIRFERSGGEWIGRYSQVSAMQQAMGFRKGEVIIRGAVADGVFKGEVLLKFKDSLRKTCPTMDTGAHWSAIELKLIDPTKLYGAWLQTYFDSRAGRECEVVAQKWQVYGLERLNLN